ncbi:hypothetical protein MUY35_05585 [Aliiroseovarius sp. S1339]|uniref:hypothetical protein n=1 Tax=Aliiroseovarius sp. S1339 TaxID=2936990 RepID=UPI0020C03A66|nr:hypothetical protein [Aliiroseovarius sp. S1339]MCK8463320.1 hypothetical protein [Aliiroseovarius sp. S1339]
MFFAAAMAAGLSACVSPSGSPTQKRSDVTIRPDIAGLQVDPIGQRIDFGRSPKGVVPVLDREMGRHTALPLDGCSAGVVQQLQWDDLVLTFSRERFVGWRQGAALAGATCAAMG